MEMPLLSAPGSGATSVRKPNADALSEGSLRCWMATPTASAVKPEVYAHLLGALTQAWDIRIGAGADPVPLLLTHGRYDYVVPFNLWARLAPGLPNATVHVFDRSGHHPFREQPDAFVAAVTAWLGQPPHG